METLGGVFLLSTQPKKVRWLGKSKFLRWNTGSMYREKEFGIEENYVKRLTERLKTS